MIRTFAAACAALFMIAACSQTKDFSDVNAPFEQYLPWDAAGKDVKSAEGGLQQGAVHRLLPGEELGLDLGLMGEGFFTYEDGDGVSYTRDGSLRLTPEGDLVSRGGRPIVWETRTNQIQPTGAELSIDSAGYVFQGNEEIGQLRLVDFQDRKGLKQDDKGYFHAPQGMTEDPATAVIYSGTYESSNVQPVNEMVEMILAQRAYQSASNTVSQIAESYSKLTQAN